MTNTNTSSAEQTDEEFFAYLETPEAKARAEKVDSERKASELAFWARHLGIDLAAAGAHEYIAAARAARELHFADMDDTGN